MDNTTNKTYGFCQAIIGEVSKVIIGKPQSIRMLVLALISGGHVLIDDVPGVGKTTIAAALAKSIGLDFKRVQLTPDVMASDISGFSVYDKASGSFLYKPGVVMTNILIADEINRTSPKTQSALLEAMEEGHVTVDGVTRPLPQPFMVIATENPLGFVGTYPLPEAQLDRFFVKFVIGYPEKDAELKIISDRKSGNPLDSVKPVVSADDIAALRHAVTEVHTDPLISRYIIELVQATRSSHDIMLAASPRASLALSRAAAANALIDGRDYVIPSDVSSLYNFVVAHRIVLSAEARLDGTTPEAVLNGILSSVKPPVLRK